MQDRKQPGRPRSENPKSAKIYTVVTPDIKRRLDEVCRSQDVDRSRYIRRAILRQLDLDGWRG